MKTLALCSFAALMSFSALASGGSHPQTCATDGDLIAQEGVGGTYEAASANATQRIESSLADFAADCQARGGTFVRCDIKSTKDWQENGNHYVTAEARFSCEN